MQSRIHCIHDYDDGDDVVVEVHNDGDDDVAHNMLEVVRILVVRNTFYLIIFFN